MWEKVTNLTQGTEPFGMCRVSPGRKREGRVDIGVGSSRVAPGEYRDLGFSELALVAPVWVCSWGLRGIPALGAHGAFGISPQSSFPRHQGNSLRGLRQTLAMSVSLKAQLVVLRVLGREAGGKESRERPLCLAARYGKGGLDLWDWVGKEKAF